MPLELSCNNPPPGKLHVPYSHSLIASGGIPPYSDYVVFEGDLPDGLTLDPDTGEISGTPTVSGQFPFLVSVTDADEDQATVECSIVIKTCLLFGATAGIVE